MISGAVAPMTICPSVCSLIARRCYRRADGKVTKLAIRTDRTTRPAEAQSRVPGVDERLLA